MFFEQVYFGGEMRGDRERVKMKWWYSKMLLSMALSMRVSVCMSVLVFEGLLLSLCDSL